LVCNNDLAINFLENIFLRKNLEDFSLKWSGPLSVQITHNAADICIS